MMQEKGGLPFADENLWRVVLLYFKLGLIKI